MSTHSGLYPSVMYEKPMPIGYPEFYDGKYEEDLVYPLYIQMITCSFELKKNKIPTIQIKKSHFIENEYLTSSNNEIVCLTLSNVDLKLFLEHYDVYDLNYICGWKFKSMKGIFTDYIDKWIGRKIEATKSGNKGMRTLAKLMLNSLYGKFATSQDMQEKYPYLEDDVVKYYLGEKDKKKGLYLPIGIFITSYAREKTIRTSQAIKDYSIEKYGKDMYIYSDTDSIHTLLPIEELKQFCEIDDFELGKWAHEGTFRKARFVRQKCYIEELREDIDYKVIRKLEDYKFNLNKIKLIKENKFNTIYKYQIKITCAGMPKSCYEFVEWENFKKGFTCGGKLTFKHVKGGVKLVETDFTIKGDTRLKNNIINF